MTLKVLSNGTDLINFGMAVAPVTDWRFYDTAYTERYMSTPQLNPDGYASSSVLQQIRSIRNNSLLLCHGTADDNVHFQNSMELVRSLMTSNIEFMAQYFPNENHGIVNLKRNIYRQLSNFLVQHHS
jgi:dipeptidyl-peptidase-4